MSANTIDAQMLARMFLSGARNLENKKDWINELNVFPVPDGDTGTNMTMTILSAVGEIEKLSEITMPTVCKAMSSGSLRGARGNSGVILSQLFRGFTKSVKDKEELGIQEIAAGIEKACETAYKAVMKPKEGTILTVARGMAEKARELAILSETEELAMEDFLKQIVDEGYATLEKTPDMLPVLKEAGVVDSGGQGLMCIMEGAYLAFIGQEVTAGGEDGQPEVLKYSYCVAFKIRPAGPLAPESVKEVKDYMTSLGEAVIYQTDSGKLRIHMHTNDPGLAIQKALTFGQLSRMKIDNMRLEHHEKVIKEAEKMAAMQKEQEPEKEVGFISVSVGEGMGGIFRDLGVDYLIEGGQTMNPSTEDVLQAIEKVNAKNIFIFPNNKNIILAANQARDLTEDRNIIVIPTKTIPQGITAMINYVPEKTIEQNTEEMLECIENVKTGQITYAVRDTRIDEKEIHQGDFMGIGDHGILAVGQELEGITLETVDAMVDEESEIISVYYGADVKDEDAHRLGEKLEERYPDFDVEVNEGGQPIYYYVVSVE